MKKIFFLLGIGLLIFFTSCDFFKSKKKVIDLVQKKINFEKSNKEIKVFFALDTECPLSKQYTKKINQLAERYSTDVDFLIFFPERVLISCIISLFCLSASRPARCISAILW